MLNNIQTLLAYMQFKLLRGTNCTILMIWAEFLPIYGLNSNRKQAQITNYALETSPKKKTTTTNVYKQLYKKKQSQGLLILSRHGNAALFSPGTLYRKLFVVPHFQFQISL